jgi:hypothetical protein
MTPRRVFRFTRSPVKDATDDCIFPTSLESRIGQCLRTYPERRCSTAGTTVTSLTHPLNSDFLFPRRPYFPAAAGIAPVSAWRGRRAAKRGLAAPSTTSALHCVDQLRPGRIPVSSAPLQGTPKTRIPIRSWRDDLDVDCFTPTPKRSQPLNIWLSQPWPSSNEIVGDGAQSILGHRFSSTIVRSAYDLFAAGPITSFR